MFLLFYLIPQIQNGRNPPDWMDYTFSALKFSQVLVLLVIVLWNNWRFIVGWPIISKFSDIVVKPMIEKIIQLLYSASLIKADIRAAGRGNSYRENKGRQSIFM